MNRIRRVVWTLAVCAPLSVLLTIALLPTWSWLEATTGLESVGHSGPAGWCYLTVYAAGAVLVGAATLRR